MQPRGADQHLGIVADDVGDRLGRADHALGVRPPAWQRLGEQPPGDLMRPRNMFHTCETSRTDDQRPRTNRPLPWTDSTRPAPSSSPRSDALRRYCGTASVRLASGPATIRPRPGCVSTRPSAASWSSARRTVLRATWYSAHSADSDGSGAPGLRSPPTKRARRASVMALYAPHAVARGLTRAFPSAVTSPERSYSALSRDAPAPSGRVAHQRAPPGARFRIVWSPLHSVTPRRAASASTTARLHATSLVTLPSSTNPKPSLLTPLWSIGNAWPTSNPTSSNASASRSAARCAAGPPSVSAGGPCPVIWLPALALVPSRTVFEHGDRA